MKKRLRVTMSLIIIGIGSVFLSSNIADNSEDEYCHYGQCSASKANGERCRNCCQSGSYYCWSHNR